jgi:hypothetical protein
MHPYSVDSVERRDVPYYLAAAALALTFAARAIVRLCGIDIGSAYIPSSSLSDSGFWLTCGVAPVVASR